MAAFPAAAGGSLVGEILVQTKLRPRHGFHLRLSCVRRATVGRANNRQITEKVLWQDEKWLRADLPASARNATSIPVFFKLPENMPESSISPGEGIQWKLEASATLRGPDFQAAFDVPVFPLPGSPEPAADPTAPYQLSLDEIRRQIRSLIEIKDLAEGGRDFVFPPARNPGFAGGATIVCLVWTAIIAVLLWKGAPVPFLLVLGAMDLLMIGFVFDLWFRRGHVRVTTAGVRVHRAWLRFSQERNFQASAIQAIASEVGATAGHTTYYDIKVVLRDGEEFVLAKNLVNKPEAEWLARAMSAALKRTEAPLLTGESQNG